MDNYGYCQNCKHWGKDESLSCCKNEKQTNEDYKFYTYYNFGCNLHETGDNFFINKESIKPTDNG